MPIAFIGTGHKFVTENFVKRILGKEDYLISPGEEGLRSVQLANAILYSGMKDEQVNVPVPEDEFEDLMEELREDETENFPDQMFDWEEVFWKPESLK